MKTAATPIHTLKLCFDYQHEFYLYHHLEHSLELVIIRIKRSI